MVKYIKAKKFLIVFKILYHKTLIHKTYKKSTINISAYIKYMYYFIEIQKYVYMYIQFSKKLKKFD